MRLIVLSVLSLGLAASGAVAQTASHSSTTHATTAHSTGAQTMGTQTAPASTNAAAAGSASAPHNAAMKDPTVAKTSASAAGANSFTEGQARDRIGKAGYTGVTALTKTSDGVWAGQAMKGKKKMRVALDFKGNVTAK